jgi:hypothetical protein
MGILDAYGNEVRGGIPSDAPRGAMPLRANDPSLERAIRRARPGSPEAAGERILRDQHMLRKAQDQERVVEMTAMSAAANFCQQAANLPDFGPELDRMLLQCRDIHAAGEQLDAESQFKVDVMHNFASFQATARTDIERFVKGKERESEERLAGLGDVPAVADIEVDALDPEAMSKLADLADSNE